VVEIARVTRESVTVTGGVDRAAAQLLGLLIGQIPAVALVEDTVGEGGPGADGEEVTLQPGAIGVDIVDGGPLNTNGESNQ
jgi:hypothetical protein